jgi:hypothetical protein
MRLNELKLFALVFSISCTSVAQAQTGSAIRNQNLSTSTNNDYVSEKYSIAGKKSVFGDFYSVKLNCTPSDWQDVKISKAPLNGTAKIFDRTAVIQFAQSNPRSSCNGKTIKAKSLEYTPHYEFKGNDEIVVEAINDSGQMNTYTYKITVR